MASKENPEADFQCAQPACGMTIRLSSGTDFPGSAGFSSHFSNYKWI